MDGIELGVPWSGWLRHDTGGRIDLLPDLPDPRTVLKGQGGPHWELIYALERGGLPPISDLSPHEVTNARRLLAAALADIGGFKIDSRDSEAVTDLLGLQHRESAAQLARDGRRLWAGLGGWPWFHWRDARRPQRWHTGIGSALAWQLAVWQEQG